MKHNLCLVLVFSYFPPILSDLSHGLNQINEKKDLGRVSDPRQLETIAFPVGVAIGAIGASLFPKIFHFSK